MANTLKKNDLSSLFPNLISVLNDYGKYLVEHYREGLKEGDHIATGNLYRSVSTEVTMNKQSFIVEFRMPDYGEYLEQGTKPHFPPWSDPNDGLRPPEGIWAWVRAKRIAYRKDDQGKLPTEKQLAFLIARKISEDGTKRTGIYETANALTANEFNKRIDAAITKDLNDSLFEIIQALNKKGKIK